MELTEREELELLELEKEKAISQEEKPKVKEKTPFPIIGQFAGGIGGSIFGAQVGHPYVGSAVGGTLGRLFGKEAFERPIEKLREKPVFTTKEFLKEPLFAPIRDISQRTAEEKAELGKEIGITGAIEAVSAPVAIGFNKVIGTVGKGVMSGLLGRRISQRGQEVGWKKLLDPQFYQNRVPKEIAIKTNDFFNKTTKVTGKRVDDIINVKYKNTRLNMIDIKNQVKSLLPKSGNPEDLLERFAPKSQKVLIKDITNDILSQTQDIENVPKIWQLRKELDKAIFGKSWTADALQYLKNIRRTLNEPIRNVSDDIANAFDNYSFVKDAEEELAKKFTAIQNKATGEIYSQDLETFVSSLLSESKDETVRLLKKLDTFLDLPDRVIEQTLNLSAAESLEKGVGLTPFQRIFLGIFGGRKLLPRIGATIQTDIPIKPLQKVFPDIHVKPFQAIKTGVGRSVPTFLTDMFAPERKIK